MHLLRIQKCIIDKESPLVEYSRGMRFFRVLFEIQIRISVCNGCPYFAFPFFFFFVFKASSCAFFMCACIEQRYRNGIPLDGLLFIFFFFKCRFGVYFKLEITQQSRGMRKIRCRNLMVLTIMMMYSFGCMAIFFSKLLVIQIFASHYLFENLVLFIHK